MFRDHFKGDRAVALLNDCRVESLLERVNAPSDFYPDLSLDGQNPKVPD